MGFIKRLVPGFFQMHPARSASPPAEREHAGEDVFEVFRAWIGLINDRGHDEFHFSDRSPDAQATVEWLRPNPRSVACAPSLARPANYFPAAPTVGSAAYA